MATGSAPPPSCCSPATGCCSCHPAGDTPHFPASHTVRSDCESRAPSFPGPEADPPSLVDGPRAEGFRDWKQLDSLIPAAIPIQQFLPQSRPCTLSVPCRAPLLPGRLQAWSSHLLVKSVGPDSLTDFLVPHPTPQSVPHHPAHKSS